MATWCADAAPVTSDGHLFKDGYVMRSIQVDSLGNVRILTCGEGVNIEKFGLPGRVVYLYLPTNG